MFKSMVILFFLILGLGCKGNLNSQKDQAPENIIFQEPESKLQCQFEKTTDLLDPSYPNDCKLSHMLISTAFLQKYKKICADGRPQVRYFVTVYMSDKKNYYLASDEFFDQRLCEMNPLEAQNSSLSMSQTFLENIELIIETNQTVIAQCDCSVSDRYNKFNQSENPRTIHGRLNIIATKGSK